MNIVLLFLFCCCLNSRDLSDGSVFLFFLFFEHLMGSFVVKFFFFFMEMALCLGYKGKVP